MRIGIVGAGNLGGTLARLLVQAGHEVALSHASGPERLREEIAALGPRARAATVEGAAELGDVVLLALPWRERGALPAARLKGKVVADATNPYRPDGAAYDLGDATSSEEVAKALPGARLVKAFNHLRADDLASRGRPDAPPDERVALFLAGDDQDAKRLVASIVYDIGFAPMDSGSLRDGGRLQQTGGPLYLRAIAEPEARALLRGGESRGAAAEGGASEP